jgi:hypothetical protein
MNRCFNCGLPKLGSRCCELTDAEQAQKSALKAQYQNLAGRNSSREGLAAFVWRNFFDAIKDKDEALALKEEALLSEQKAWKEKHDAITALAAQHLNKYKPILEEKDKEISYLQSVIDRQRELLAQFKPGDSPGTVTNGCPGCGSTFGCYCK